MGWNIFRACFGLSRNIEPVEPQSAVRRGSLVQNDRLAENHGGATLEVLSRDNQVASLREKLNTVEVVLQLGKASVLAKYGRFSVSRRIYEKVAADYPPGSRFHDRAVNGLDLLAKRLRCLARNRSNSDAVRERAGSVANKLAVRVDSMRSR